MDDDKHTVVVRLTTGDFDVIEVGDRSTIGHVMHHYFPDTVGSIHCVKRDAMQRIISTSEANYGDKVLNYAANRLATPLPSTVKSMEGAKKATTPSEEEDQFEKNCFLNCSLWMVSRTVRVFFNPYIRMVLGLPQWYLELPIDQYTMVADLDCLIKECLGIAPEDDRFVLYGNFGSHVSTVDEEASVLRLTDEEDPANQKFWQYMMIADKEVQENLGISRQSSLWLQEPGSVLGSREYWIALQGTTLSYFKKPFDHGSRKKIEHLDRCQVIYRGSNQQKKTFRFEIITPDGSTYRLKSSSKKRIETWVRVLKQCHQYHEINEPITMEMVKKMTAPQDHPSEPPLVTNKRRGVREYGAMQTTRDGSDSKETRAINLDSMVQKITTNAMGMGKRNRMRQKDPHRWVEHIRRFLITIIKVESRDYIFSIIPEISSLVSQLKNFLELVDGNSEFIMISDRSGKIVNDILKSINCLVVFYKDAINMEKEENKSTVEGPEYECHQKIVKRLRRTLKQPITSIKLDRLKITKEDSNRLTEKHASVIETTPGGKPPKKSFFNWFNRGGKSKRRAKIPETEIQELSIHDPSHAEPQNSSHATDQITIKSTNRRLIRKEKHGEERQEQQGLDNTKTSTTVWSTSGVNNPREHHSRHPSTKSEASSSLMADDELSGSIIKFKGKYGHHRSSRLHSQAPKSHHAPFPVAVPNSPSSSFATPLSRVSISETVIEKPSEGANSGYSSIIDEYDQSAVAVMLQDPSQKASHGPKDSLSHRRSISMRTGIITTKPTMQCPAMRESVDKAIRDPHKRKSLIEIDQVLLNALLKDPRLAELIHPANIGEETDGGREQPSPHETRPKSARENLNVDPFEPATCELCSDLVKESVDLLRTPFATFHRQCLICDQCGIQLTTQSFRLEGGKAQCRIECPSSTTSLIPQTPRQPKSILKKSATSVI